MSRGKEPLTRAEVIKRCQDLITKYNPIIMTVDSYAEQALGKDCEGKNADPDKALMKQVLYGCVTNKKALKVFLTHFYGDLAAFVLRSDYTLYQVFAYLIMFRLHELGWDGLKAFVAEHEPGKMFQILNYIFISGSLQRGVKQEWLDVFDIDYIDNVIWGGLQQYRAEANKLCASLEAQAFGAATAGQEVGAAVPESDGPTKQVAASAAATSADAKAKAKQPPKKKGSATVPHPPKLHPPRRRRVPTPMAVSNKLVIGEEPTSLHSNSLERIEKKQKARREQTVQQTLNKYKESDLYKLHETRATIERTRREQEEIRQAALDFDRSFVNPVPKYPEKDASVRLNASAILREDALFKKKQESEVKLLKAYEEDLRDSTEFYTWQGQVRAHDKEVQKARVEERRLLAKASAEEAKAALERQRLDNKAYAHEIRKEGVLMVQQRHAEIELGVAMNRQLVKEVQEVERKAPILAKEKVWHQHKRMSKALKEEKAAAWARKVEEDAVEAEIKADKIRRLKADHEVIKKPVKVFDPTETSGVGFLNEISLMEVRERLKMNKLKEKEHEENKRIQILSEKSKKQEQMAKRLENIRRLREAAHSDAKKLRVEKMTAQREAEVRERLDREARQMHLLEDLEIQRIAREQELAKLAEEERKVKEEQRRLHEAHEEMLRRKAEKEAREAAESKAGAEEAQAARRKARIDEIKARERRRKISVPMSPPARYQEDPDVTRAKQENQEKYDEEARLRRMKWKQVRQEREALRHKIILMNPYAHTVTTRSIEEARKKTGHHTTKHDEPTSQDDAAVGDDVMDRITVNAKEGEGDTEVVGAM